MTSGNPRYQPLFERTLRVPLWSCLLFSLCTALVLYHTTTVLFSADLAQSGSEQSESVFKPVPIWPEDENENDDEEPEVLSYHEEQIQTMEDHIQRLKTQLEALNVQKPKENTSSATSKGSSPGAQKAFAAENRTAMTSIPSLR